jgi:arylsulfatase A-like enzyme
MEDEVNAHKVNNDGDWEIYRSRYDEFVRYCDREFEKFINEWNKREQSKNTIIIFTSDHGESFEHDYFTHNDIHHYEQVTHIPLIIKEPGCTEGVSIDHLVGQIDLPPTILRLANIEVPSWMEGRSLLTLLRGQEIPSKHIYSMSFQKNPSTGEKIHKGTIAVWEDNYKLIHYLEDDKSLLFNLEQDPDELNNLFDEKPEIGQHLLSLIQDNLEKANRQKL